MTRESVLLFARDDKGGIDRNETRQMFVIRVITTGESAKEN
jgi:hypothetical protein